MEIAGDAEAAADPCTDHPAEPCMGVGSDNLAAAATSEEEETINRPVAVDTASSNHHAAAHPEQSAERSTLESEEEKEKVLDPVPLVPETTASDHQESAVPVQASEGSSASSEEEVPVPDPDPAAKEKEKEHEQKQKQESAADDGQESTRERLKRHRREMAGRVWVPDMWGQEKLLKDWVDCAVFDRPLVPPDLLTARRALVAECCTRRPDRTAPPAAASSPLRVQNGCS
ncbi:hypothetical protein GUJ93_ZPchr0014g47091 [Zizania palustris]|uniref:Protein BIC1 n=1 Tax=Zizania palustris TaxID=103762 RepID=A0A8J5VRP1_ZIZPA|nr:hypothetical protein GUJ93_ZPchr0014g47091 [Zizania palustris]